MAKKKLTLVDLFAGCGGVALGFHDAGFETLIANEMHPDPADTYRKKSSCWQRGKNDCWTYAKISAKQTHRSTRNQTF